MLSSALRVVLFAAAVSANSFRSIESEYGMCDFEFKYPTQVLDLSINKTGEINLNVMEDGELNPIVLKDGSPIRGCNSVSAEWLNRAGEFRSTIKKVDGTPLLLHDFIYSNSLDEIHRRNIQQEWEIFPTTLENRPVRLNLTCSDAVTGCIEFTVTSLSDE